MTDLHRVSFQGGKLHGAVLEMSGGLATRIHTMELVITDSGEVKRWDVGPTQSRWVPMPTIRVVQGPQPRQLPEVVEAPTRKRRLRGIPKTA